MNNLKEFPTFNKLLYETNDNFELDNTIDNIDMYLEDVNNIQQPVNNKQQTNQPQNPATPANPTEISQQAIMISKMSPEEIQTLLTNASKLIPKQPTEFEMIKAQFKGIVRHIVMMSGIGYVGRYAVNAFTKAKEYGQANITPEMKKSIIPGGLPWYYFACGIIGMITACYMVMRKKAKKSNAAKQITESVHYLILDEEFTLENTYRMLNESTGVEAMTDFINKGFALLATFGKTISDNANNADIPAKFNNFCIQLQRYGIYVLTKMKSYINVSN